MDCMACNWHTDRSEYAAQGYDKSIAQSKVIPRHLEMGFSAKHNTELLRGASGDRLTASFAVVAGPAKRTCADVAVLGHVLETN
jgi:hypothetical protein